MLLTYFLAFCLQMVTTEYLHNNKALHQVLATEKF